MSGTYICDPEGCLHADPAPDASVVYMRAMRLCRDGSGHCWHESTARRLEWQGGPSANAAADLDAWNSLGHRRSNAA
jgi:hypothetical protein